jgi:hypothetical protein
MNRQHHFQVLVFCFALVMVLLRPYAAYRIAGLPDLGKDQGKVNSILQRLIQKKDEHHALADNDLLAVQRSNTNRFLSLTRFLFITQVFFAFTANIRHWLTPSHQIFKSYSNKHYLLFARLQI